MKPLLIYNQKSIRIFDGVLHYAGSQPDLIQVMTSGDSLIITVLDTEDNELAVATINIQVDPHLYFCVMGIARRHILGIAKQKEKGND